MTKKDLVEALAGFSDDTLVVVDRSINTSAGDVARNISSVETPEGMLEKDIACSQRANVRNAIETEVQVAFITLGTPNEFQPKVVVEASATKEVKNGKAKETS